MSRLKLAIQKSGRLSEKSLRLLKESGIKFSNGDRKLRSDAKNFPLELLFLRDDDIPQYVSQGVADIGIVGLNEVEEQGHNLGIVQKLGFSQCRLSLAIPKDMKYDSREYFNRKRIATSYPNILRRYFEENDINAEIEEISGSVEIAPGIGLADGIFDIVSTGSTLIMNGLKEVETVLRSEAIMVSKTDLDTSKQELLDNLLFRINALINARNNKYILLNAPNDTVSDIIKIIPGMKSPTVLPLADRQWSSVHSVVPEDEFWEVIDQLKSLGAQGILVVPIEKMIAQ